MGGHLAGCWEFPGGKVEAGESRLKALGRELSEELGIVVEQARPLIKLHHRYSDRCVVLDVWQVEGYSGMPTGREGQRLETYTLSQMELLNMPEADLPVIKALGLPDYYCISPPVGHCRELWLHSLDRTLASGMRLVQLRDPSAGTSADRALVISALERCERYGAQLLLNSENAVSSGAHGIHQSARSAGSTDLSLHGISCHNLPELKAAEACGATFAVLSAVNATGSHPDAKPLGWEAFRAMVEQVNLPVYALGGMRREDLDRAREHGAQGVAGISAFWQARETVGAVDPPEH